MKNILGCLKCRGTVIIDEEILFGLILKPAFLTTNMAIEITKKHQAPIFLKIKSSNIYSHVFI